VGKALDEFLSGRDFLSGGRIVIAPQDLDDGRVPMVEPVPEEIDADDGDRFRDLFARDRESLLYCSPR